MRTIPIPAMTEKQIKVFWSRVQIGGFDECWPYLGRRDRDGYGWKGLGRRQYPSHRIAFTLVRGPIPTDSMVCHSCDNPPCCNPLHHFHGNQFDNIGDAANKNRMRHGEEHPASVLTESQVLQIRGFYQRGVRGRGHKTIAKQFGVNPRVIWNIVNGVYWKHLI